MTSAAIPSQRAAAPNVPERQPEPIPVQRGARERILRLSFDVRRVESDPSGQRWHWLVYDGAEGCFVRNGQVTGGQDEAERVARAAIAQLGGVVEVARR